MVTKKKNKKKQLGLSLLRPKILHWTSRNIPYIYVFWQKLNRLKTVLDQDKFSIPENEFLINLFIYI